MKLDVEEVSITSPFRIIVSDVARRNLEYWFSHSKLKPLFDQGLLEAALIDGEAIGDEITLSSGKVLSKSTAFSALQKEIQQKLPILEDKKFFQGWIFCYDENCPGVTPHADPGAINVNIWCTPDGCILDKDKNGLILYNIKPPEDWTWDDYNRNLPKIEDYLEENQAVGTKIPYKYKRAVVFDSRYFHETDNVSTKPGIGNKRINITFMYK